MFGIHMSLLVIHTVKDLSFRLMGTCLSRMISLYFPETLRLAFILIEISCFVLFSLAFV